MDRDIEALVQACQPCHQSVKNSSSASPLHPWLWPSKPWVRIHIDFADPFQMFMLIVDAHSNWPEIIKMPSVTASKTIDELRKLFAAYGLPEQVVTDNCPQFIADEFTLFLKQNSVKHLKCSLYHPSSNGTIERLAQSFKKLLKASESDGRTVSHRLSSFLFTYRSTLHAFTKTTPSGLFLKRSLTTHLDLLQLNVESAVHLSQAKHKTQHDSHAKGREFSIGESIMANNLRTGAPWLPGTITERLGPVTYLVQMKTKLTWKRHVDQLRSQHQATDETAPEFVSVDDYIPAHTSITDAVSENSGAQSPNAPASFQYGFKSFSTQSGHPILV